MMDLLAAADPQLSGAWVLELVMKIFAGFALLIGAAWAAYRKGVANGTSNTETTLKSPVPTITVKEDVELVTKEELNEHLLRIEKKFDEIIEAVDGERGIARTANGNLHKRIDLIAERLSTCTGRLEGVDDNVSRLLDIALGLQPGTTRRQRKSQG